MDDFQQIIREQVSELGRRWLIERITLKLSEVGVDAKPSLVTSIADQIIADGGEGELTIEGEDSDERLANFTLEFTDEDLADFDKAAAGYQAKLNRVVVNFTTGEAARFFRTLKSKWPEEFALQQKEMEEFRRNLEGRWGEGFGLLRTLLTCSREIGGDFAARNARSKSRRNRSLHDVLMKLHARACQVTAETITLMENGYADGAMARWRTLYEIGVVARVIADGGDELAQRYIAHQKVEAKLSLDEYHRCHVALGYKPFPKSKAKRIEAANARVLEKYGKEFGSPYGWAAEHLKKKKPSFSELQLAAGRAEMASHFRMASHGIHAGPQGMYFKLGLLGPKPSIISGASNAGFAEPAQNVALTLAQVTSLLWPKHPGPFDLIWMKAFVLVREAIPQALLRADRKLKRDDAAVRRNR